VFFDLGSISISCSGTLTSVILSVFAIFSPWFTYF
jgi:hypothetical protein